MATLPFSIAALHCWLAFRTQGHLLVAVSPLSTATLLCWLVLQDPRAPPYGHLTIVHGRGSNVPFLENPSLSVSLLPGAQEELRTPDSQTLVPNISRNSQQRFMERSPLGGGHFLYLGFCFSTSSPTPVTFCLSVCL